MNTLESSLFGLAGWATSFSIRNIAHNLIYKHDIKQVKKNINRVEKITDLNEAQRDFDLIEIIIKEAMPIVLGLASLYLGLAAGVNSLDVAVSAATFGLSHLAEAYYFHRKFNWQKYQKK